MWTTDLPKVPGWYWRRYEHEQAYMEIVQVDVSDAGIVAHSHGNGSWVPTLQQPGVEWAGPLSVPLDARAKAEGKRQAVIAISSGSYDDYRCNYYYVADGFSWAKFAVEIDRRKRLLHPGRKKYTSSDEVVEQAMKALGCEPIKADLQLCVDEVRISYSGHGDESKANYDDINRFIDSLKDKESPFDARAAQIEEGGTRHD